MGHQSCGGFGSFNFVRQTMAWLLAYYDEPKAVPDTPIIGLLFPFAWAIDMCIQVRCGAVTAVNRLLRLPVAG